MLTLTTDHKEKLQAAHERGKGLEVVASQQPGVYFVRAESEPSKFYQVIIWKEAGEVKSECSCPSKKHICKHLAVAAKVYQDYLIKTLAVVKCHKCPNQAESVDSLYCVGCNLDLATDRADLFGI
jgi:hypothetical protein